MKRRQQKQSISFFAFQDIITAVVGIFIFILLILFMELTQLTQAESPTPSQPESPMYAELQTIMVQNQQLERLINENMVDEALEREIPLIAASPEDQTEEKSSRDQIRNLNRQINASEDSLEKEQQKNALLKKRWQELDAFRKAIEESQTNTAGKHETPDLEEDAPRLVYRDTTAGRYLCLIIVGQNITIKDAQTKTVRKFDSVSNAIAAIKNLTPYDKHVVLMFKPSGADQYDSLYPFCKERFTNFGFDLIVEDMEISMGYEWEQEK